MIRQKMIEEMTLHPQNIKDEKADQILVELKTSAGTYVKEFMHGDEGRTNPCLATLLEAGKVTVLHLDVLEIHLDWPPQIQI